MRTLLIDNYDSYTYNLFQLLAEVNGHEPIVIRNDEITWHTAQKLQVDNIVISPGPGHPSNERDFGICRRALLDSTVPVLGVCLGHQGLGVTYGASVLPAPEVVHGRPDPIFHDDSALFAGIPQGFRAVRYHSLVVGDNLPACLEKTAWTSDGIIMGLRHRERPLWSVQFHPESICTEYGKRLLENFRALTSRWAAGAPGMETTLPVKEGGEKAPLIAGEALKVRPHRTSIPVKEELGTGLSAEAPVVSTSEPSLMVRTRRLDTLIPPEQLFVHVYGNEQYAFWLDSSRVEHGLSRFSFIGANTGPLSKVIHYRAAGQELTITKQGVATHHQRGIFDYLDEELARLACSAAELPFDFAGGFVGYFGYELKAECGSQLVHHSPLPDAIFIFADQMLAFDHHEEATYLVHIGTRDDASAADTWFASMEQRLRTLPPLPPVVTMAPGADALQFRLHQPYASYIDNIERCQQLLVQGESYEICLTTQFSTAAQPDPLAIYRHLRRINPAPHSAFLRLGDVAILSSSPERFLRVDRRRQIEAKPIKGTAPRGSTSDEDAKLRGELENNEKMRAENLMIVDLLRNDLGLVSQVGSVHVPKLMAIESFATVHQIVSTIQGMLREDITAIDCVRAAFPGGSMTGAPKLRTMEIIDAIEPEARGIYSGALGFLGLNGTTDLSIVIRTIISTPDAMHIGAGGAITIQSDPRAEFDEMLLKAQPLMRAIATSVHGHAGPGTYHVAGGRASGLPEQLPTGTQELYRWTMVGAGEVQPDPATRSKP